MIQQGGDFHRLISPCNKSPLPAPQVIVFCAFPGLWLGCCRPSGPLPCCSCPLRQTSSLERTGLLPTRSTWLGLVGLSAPLSCARPSSSSSPRPAAAPSSTLCDGQAGGRGCCEECPLASLHSLSVPCCRKSGCLWPSSSGELLSPFSLLEGCLQGWGYPGLGTAPCSC